MNTTLESRDYTAEEMAEALNALGNCHREMKLARMNEGKDLPATMAETQAEELLQRYSAQRPDDEGAPLISNAKHLASQSAAVRLFAETAKEEIAGEIAAPDLAKVSDVLDRMADNFADLYTPEHEAVAKIGRAIMDLGEE